MTSRPLQRPITAEGVVEWKQRIIGDKAESEPYPSWEEFADRLGKQEYKEAYQTESPPTKPTDEELVSPRIKTAIVSFAAAALFLFIDLDMSGVRDEKPYRLAEQIRKLARIIQRLMTDLGAREQELEKLLANRAAGHQPRPESDYYQALRYWRYGHSEEDIARWLGITPYSSKAGEGTRDWKTKLHRMLARGEEIENERYPEAAAIFAKYTDNPHNPPQRAPGLPYL